MSLSCGICSGNVEVVNMMAWCESCLGGESLVYAGREDPGQDYGIREAREYLSDRGKVLTLQRVNFLRNTGSTGEGRVLDLFCGSGGTTKALATVFPMTIGYEPFKSYTYAQEILETTDRIVYQLVSDWEVDAVTFYSGFTSVLKPENILTLYDPTVVVIDCPIFDGRPQEMPFWDHAGPYNAARSYSMTSISKLMRKLGYVFQSTGRSESGRAFKLTAWRKL